MAMSVAGGVVSLHGVATRRPRTVTEGGNSQYARSNMFKHSRTSREYSRKHVLLSQLDLNRNKEGRHTEHRRNENAELVITDILLSTLDQKHAT
jgi:hypothetical protein